MLLVLLFYCFNRADTPQTAIEVMARILIFLCACTISAYGQIRMNSLVIEPHESFQLVTSDILVVDTLVMKDSSRIVLNKLKQENYIRTKIAIIGKRCLIDGKGINGKPGKPGTGVKTPIGPCQPGIPGKNGQRGLDGTAGVNLFLYIDKLIINGELVIDLSGGSGGDGGNGGEGGGGSPGTVHCSGGNGGTGGNGGLGANGGPGGILHIGGLDSEVIRSILGSLVLIRNRGGNFGYGGIAGYGGSPGLGPAKKGKRGKQGSDGVHGESGSNGSIQFEQQ